MDALQTLIALTLHIRDTVRPHLGTLQSRRVTGTAASGDATFAIDEIAEEAISEYIAEHNLPLAYYSEDRGLVLCEQSPEAVLVIDPIDGTRPAIAGFEQCVVSVAWADYKDGAPTMADVMYGCIAELKLNDYFYAERGRGAHWISNDSEKQPKPLQLTTLRDAPVSFEVVARPFEYIGVILSGIVDMASLKGGCFVFNSTAYSLTRLLTGQLGGSIDIGNRMMREIPPAREKMLALGLGKAIGLFTYDIAAAALIASEAGAVVTDANGNGFDHVPLLDTSESNLLTMCAASNAALHQLLLDEINAGFERILTQ